MEAVWAGLWYAAIFSPAGGLAAGWICLAFWGIMAGSYGLALGMEELRWPIGRRRWIFLVWLAAAGLATLNWILAPQPLGFLDLLALPVRSLIPGGPLPAGALTSEGVGASALPFLHLIGVVLLGLRGLALAHGQPDTRTAVFDMQIGLVFILLYGISLLPIREELDPGGLEVYLFLGLITLGATRISTVSASPGGRLPRFGPGWAAGLALGAGLVVALGLLTGALASSQAGALFARILLGVIALLGLLFFILLLPLMDFVLHLALTLMAKMGGLFDNPLFKNFQDLIDRLNRLAGQEAIRSLNLVHMLQTALPLLILLGLLALVFFGLRLRASWQELRAEEEEGLRPGATAGLLRLARLELGRRRLSSPARLLAAARIRRIYAELLNLSARLGGTRPAQLTPLEFLPRLSEVFAGQEAGLEQITAAYLRVRYGEYPESLGEVQVVEAAWQRIRRQSRALRRGVIKA